MGVVAAPPTTLTSSIEFLAMYDDGDVTDRLVMLSILDGALDGLVTANSILGLRHQEPLFCLTGSARIAPKTALDQLREEVKTPSRRS
jgi:hypothetical protein